MHWVDEICSRYSISINELARITGKNAGYYGMAKQRNTPIAKLGYATLKSIAKALRYNDVDDLVSDFS